MSETPQPLRWRCMVKGCNPVLDEKSAADHKQITTHNVARWPQRSAAGEQRARARRANNPYARRYASGKRRTREK